LAFQSFDFERTWWMLFQKRVVHTKFDMYVCIRIKKRHERSLIVWYSAYICKTQIDVQPLIDVQTTNPCPIRNRHLSFFKFLNRRLFMAVSHLLNLRPMMSLTYALAIALINKSIIDLRIWKWRLFENTLKFAPDLR